MSVELRQRDLGQLLGQVLEVTAAQFGRLFLIQVITMTPELVAQLLLRPGTGLEGLTVGVQLDELLPKLAAFYGKLVVLMVISAFAYPIGATASTLVIQRMFEGRPQRLGACLRDSLRLYPGGLMLTVTLGILVALGTAACILPGMLVRTMFFVAAPVFVIERTGWTGAPGRARALVGGLGQGGRFLEVFVVYLLVEFAPGLVLVPIFMAVALIPSESAQALIDHLIAMTISTLIAAAAPVVYYHLRVVREAHDIERLAALVDVIGATAPGAEVPPVAPAPPAPGAEPPAVPAPDVARGAEGGHAP